ncbi:MAG TPA: DUF3592 domain-containing protein [Tepidisphaeraceae bacterium]|nr:DUF3592 domain-containing protein [Tepidisphaeraceae bacterium]
MSQAADPDLPALLPPVPRPLNARASRRAWNELPVRIWVLLTVAVALATVYVTVTRLQQALNDRRLIEQGLLVHAKVVAVNGSPTPKRWPRNEQMTATIDFTLPSGQPIHESIDLEARPDAYLQVGTEVQIRVDPDNPQRWTEQEKAQPWSHEMVIPAGLVPVIFLLSIISILQRRRVLTVWREGTLAKGTVVRAQHSAAAPMSRIVHFTFSDTDDRRVWKVLVPASFGIPRKGDSISVIFPQGNPRRAIAATPYGDLPGGPTSVDMNASSLK